MGRNNQIFFFSFFICILGLLAECEILNIFFFIPFQRELWHLLCFIFFPVFGYFIVSRLIPKIINSFQSSKASFWFVMIPSLIIAILVEMCTSKLNATLFSMEKIVHVIINLIGLEIFAFIYYKILRKK